MGIKLMNNNKNNNKKELKMKHEYSTKGTCSRKIILDIENGVINEAIFEGGCHGNTQGISALVKGMDAKDVIDRLSGIRCGFKPTSCPDQLAQALRAYLKNN